MIKYLSYGLNFLHDHDHYDLIHDYVNDLIHYLNVYVLYALFNPNHLNNDEDLLID